MLDYSQIKAGKFRKNILQFDIKEAMEDIMMLFEKNAKNIGLDFELELKDFYNNNFIVSSDKERIQ